MLVLDTGLRTHGKVKALAIEHPDLVGTARTHDEWRRSSDPLASDDDDEPDVNANHRLDLQSGHGTFIAGIVRQSVPRPSSTSKGCSRASATATTTRSAKGCAERSTECPASTVHRTWS